jgi:hypothetical protein
MKSGELGFDHIGLPFFGMVDEQDLGRRRAGIHAVVVGPDRLDEDRSRQEFPPGTVLQLDRQRNGVVFSIGDCWGQAFVVPRRRNPAYCFCSLMARSTPPILKYNALGPRRQASMLENRVEVT